MNDGTTATFSPVQESDMAKVKEIFQQALNAIMAATELSRTVEAMKSDVEQLRRDISDTQARNVELDRLLADTRRQRDDAEQALAQAKASLDTVNRQYQEEIQVSERHRIAKESLEAKLSAAITERDDHGLEAMALRDALAAANAKLESIHKTMGVPFTPFTVEPVKAPEPLSATPPAFAPPPIQAITDEPQIILENPVKVYEGDPAFDWSKPYAWDYLNQKHVQTG